MKEFCSEIKFCMFLNIYMCVCPNTHCVIRYYTCGYISLYMMKMYNHYWNFRQSYLKSVLF